MTDPKLDIRIFGPDVTKEGAVEVGEQFVKVIDAVAEGMGLPAGLWACNDAEIACDSCDARRAWDDEGTGWVRTADGHDYCIDCIITKPRDVAAKNQNQP